VGSGGIFGRVKLGGEEEPLNCVTSGAMGSCFSFDVGSEVFSLWLLDDASISDFRAFSVRINPLSTMSK
jgi:hypothetical protein